MSGAGRENISGRGGGGYARLLLLALLVACAAGALLFLSAGTPDSRVARAANPASGTVGQTGPVTPPDGKWTGTATGGATTDPLDGEAGCSEGTTCDTFNLTVLPGVYTGKVVRIDVTWTNPSNDYDLVIYKGGTCPATGKCNGQFITSSGNGATSGVLTEEHAQIDPTATGAGDYKVRVVYFAAPPASAQADPPRGQFSIGAVAAARNANYVSGGITFSPNVTLKAPVAARDGEPSARTDIFGNHYVGAIRGVPAGNDLWYVDLRPTVGNAPNPNYDPWMRNWAYRGQPDSVTGSPVASAGAQGGGDIDLAVGLPDTTTGALTEPAQLAASSLLLTNITTQKSTDRGVTIQRNPLGNATGGVPGDDRQWHEFHGPNNVYLLYRTVAPTVTQIQRSTDGGLTYGPAQTAGLIGQVGSIDVHQKSGRVYVSGSTGQVCHSTTSNPVTGEALAYVCTQAASGDVANIFFPVKVADDGTPFGTAYVPYSNGKDIFLVHSTDGGVTWSAPVRVSNGAEARTNLLPWMETGPTQGSVGIVWYGTSEETNNNNANWKVFFAQSFNATADNPTFRQVAVSDHFNHASNISLSGLDPTGEGVNRNLIDYFQISFDPTGAAVVAYTDDHNDFDGHTYVARQISGPAINTKGVVPSPGPTPAAQTGPVPLAASVGGIAGSQVTDFRGDVQTGLVGHISADDPLDIVSISYTCETGPGGVPVVVAKMKVSNLAVVPPASNWRMNFTANAPFTGVSPTGDYSFALPDRGDQFYVQANTDNPAGTFTWGTAVRNGDGSITYTPRGAADCGAFDTAAGTITIKVAVSKLNQFASKGAISAGEVMAGLRGQTFTSQANGKRDITRGGTEFTVGSCVAAPATGCAAVVDPTPTPTPTPNPTPTPTPTPGPTPAQAFFQFDSAAYAVQEDCVAITVRVVRTGLTTTRASIDVASNDGTAKQKGDYTIVVGRLVFEAGETEKTFQVLINEDAYSEGTENATLVLQNPQNGGVGAPSAASLQIVDDAPESSTNPIDDSRTFVCTHYHDFLYRQADAAGEDFWTNGIESCGADAQCRDAKRVDVSTAFFLSIEFQTTGYFVIRTHKAGFGNEKFTPRYTVFLRDLRQISEGVVVGQPGFQARLEANRQKYLEDFVTRTQFTSQFPPGMTAAQFVDKLFANVGTTPTAAERNAAMAAYGAGDTAGRVAALKSVADSDTVYAALYNPSFVLMQYFGYLRRNPDDSPDGNFAGYDFWLAKMNSFSQPGENVRNEAVALSRVRRAEMVRSFIVSFEYRRRFHGAPGGNQEGPSVPGDDGEVFLRYTLRPPGPEAARAAPVLFDPFYRRLWVRG